MNKPTETELYARDMTPPMWAKSRPAPWMYMGWIKNPPSVEATFESLCDEAVCVAEGGDVREIDIYPQGAVIWLKEA